MSDGRSIWLVSIPLMGHLGPLLQQGRELARRGWNVSVATSEEGAGAVARFPELEFINLGPSHVDREGAGRLLERVTAEPDFGRGLWLIVTALAEPWGTMYDGLSAELKRRRPDIMVVDLASTAGLDAADAAGVPFVVNNADLLTTLPAGLLPAAPHVPPVLSERSARKPLSAAATALHPLRRVLERGVVSATVGRMHNKLRRSRGLPPVDFHQRLLGRLILVNSAFGLEYPRPLPPLIRMVGPMLPEVETLPPELDAWLNDGPPVALVSFGTVSAPPSEMLRRVAQGLGSESFRALWALRADLHGELPDDRPAAVRVEAWLPQLAAVLRHPNVRVFVSHCGTNSVQESLVNGTPVVGIPLFGVQRDMAIRVEDAGVGVHLPKHRFTPADLRGAIERVMDEAYRANLPALQSSMRLAGGVTRAADLIEEAARVGVAHYAEESYGRRLADGAGSQETLEARRANSVVMPSSRWTAHSSGSVTAS
mgnify:CR=1 FL=1